MNNQLCASRGIGNLREAIGWTEPAPRTGLPGLVTHTLKVLLLRSQPHQYVRYAPALKHLRKHASGSDADAVLEVGSGSLGVTRYWSRPVTGLDLRFEGARLEYLEQCTGTATRLPFSDGSFDTVLAIDVLEHLGCEDRRRAVREMIRVSSRDVLIAVPCAPAAEVIEQKGRKKWHRALRSVRTERRRQELQRRGAFLEEHVECGLPTVEEMLELIAAEGREQVDETEAVGNESVWTWSFLMPSLVPLTRWSVPARRLVGLVVLPMLLRNRWGGFYRHYFIISKKPTCARPERQGGE